MQQSVSNAGHPGEHFLAGRGCRPEILKTMLGEGLLPESELSNIEEELDTALAELVHT